MARTLDELSAEALRRLGDVQAVIWTADELAGYVETAYQQVAAECRLFWDWCYAENLPGHFSYTHAWELACIQSRSGMFEWGQANYTYDAERRLLRDERQRVGPCWVTSPADLPFLSDVGASTSVPATAILPDTIQQIDRGVYDRRAIDALEPRTVAKMDARYLLNEGAVDGYLWELDGLHVLRKWRKPAAIAQLADVDGSWGLCRDVSDISSDLDVSGTFGIARRIPGHHPLGAESFGAPRRPYLDGTNVRLEVYRYGRDISEGAGCELPDRYADGLIHAALEEAYRRPGAGQDLKLSQFYGAKWARIIARLTRWLAQMQKERTFQMGGTSDSSVQRPASPSLPWPYPAMGVR